jgi:serine/threonine protein kinase
VLPVLCEPASGTLSKRTPFSVDPFALSHALRDGNVSVALKELHMGISDLNEEEQSQFVQEIRLMSKLEHPNVVQSFGVSISDDQTSLILVLVRLSLSGTLLTNQCRS